MKQSTHVCRVALASVVLLTGGVMSDLLPARAAAQQATTRADQRKWEYCSITPTLVYKEELGGHRTYYVARISYHRPAGTQQETIESNSSDEAMSKALAKLGEDGWEMTGVAAFSSDTNGGATVLYFKRAR